LQVCVCYKNGEELLRKPCKQNEKFDVYINLIFC